MHKTKLWKKKSLLAIIVVLYLMLIFLPQIISYFVLWKNLEKSILTTQYEINGNIMSFSANEIEQVMNNYIYLSHQINNASSVQRLIKQSNISSEDVLLIRDVVETYNSVYTSSSNKLYYTICVDKFLIKNWSGSISDPEEFYDFLGQNETSLEPSITPNYAYGESSFYQNLITIKRYLYNNSSFSNTSIPFFIGIPEVELKQCISMPSEESEIYILDGTGKILLSFNDSTGMMLEDLHPDLNIFSQKFDPLTDSNYVVNTTEISYADWRLVCISPKSVLTRHLTVWREYLTFFSFFAFFLFGLCLLILGGFVISPIKKISSAMQKLDFKEQKIKEQKNAFIKEIDILETNYILMHNQINQLLHDAAENEKIKYSLQFQALQQQINPHFLFNTLNTIKWSIKNNNQDKSFQLVQNLIGLLDGISFKNIVSMIPITNEINYAINYIELMKLRLEVQVETNISIAPDLTSYLVPRMILQPIVENYFLHGIKNERTDNCIKISVWHDCELVRIEIGDNGAGMESVSIQDYEKKRNYFNGIGLQNVDQRLRMLYHGDKKNNPCGVSVQSRPVYDGTLVTLTLPYHFAEESDNEKCDID